MIDAATVHNSTMFLVRLYGELLADQEKQLQLARQQIEILKRQLEALTTEPQSAQT